MNKKQKRILCGASILIGLLLIFGTVYVAVGADNNQVSRSSEMNKNMTPPTNDQNNTTNDNSKNQNQWSIPNNNQKNEMTNINNSQTNLTYGQIVLIVFGTCLVVCGVVYLVVSKFGDIDVFINKDKTIIYILLSLLITLLLSFGELTFINKKLLNSDTNNVQINQINNSKQSSNGNL